jgi:hypothetical protein
VSSHTAGGITFNAGGATDITANGGGITLKGTTDKTLNWIDATDAWTSSEHLNIASTKEYYINGNSVLSATTLGSGVAGSSLTSVGTLTGGLNIASSQTYKVNSAEVLSSSKLTLNGSSSGTVAFQAAATAGSITYTLPSADASVSGYALVSNASGTLSWAAAGATIASDTSTTTLYLGMSTATSGSWTAAKVNSNLVFNGATSTLTVPKIIVGDNTTSTGALVVGSANSFAGGLVLGKPGSYSGYISATDNLYIRSYASSGTGSGNVVIENASGTAQFTMNTSNGNLTIAGTFTESSSITLKENVNPITNALDTVMQLVGVTYDRKNGSATNEAGLIAEDVDKILPNLVKHREDGSAEGIQYTKLTAYLVEAIKTLKAEIDQLKGNK